MQSWLFFALMASFAVKMPMWPVHTWLPDAHVEAPTAGSVILAGVLLKMGAYGFLRFSVPMLPDASQTFAPLMFTLSVIAVIYTSFVALAQEDMKKLIAYSSVAHMGIVTIGIFTFNEQGVQGALFQMLSHGIVSGALFLIVGVIYDRIHTRDIVRYGGLADRMPAYALVFMVFTMATMGLPATSGFVGEFLVIIGAAQINFWLALFGGLGMVLGAAYMLYLYRRVIFGTITHADLKNILDLNPREWAVFAPLVVLTLWMGIYPSSFTGFFDESVAAMVQHHHAAVAHPRFDSHREWCTDELDLGGAGAGAHLCRHGDPDIRRVAPAGQHGAGDHVHHRRVSGHRPAGRDTRPWLRLQRPVRHRCVRDLQQRADPAGWRTGVDPGARLEPVAGHCAVRVSGAGAVRHGRHDGDGVGVESDDAVSGSGTAIAGALRAGGFCPRQFAIIRGRS